MTGLLAAATSAADKRIALRAGLNSGQIQRLPGAFNPLVAKLIQEIGFEGVYVSGAVMSAELGLPDIGLTTLTEVTARGQQIARVTDLPVRGPVVPCDRRLMRQALTNLLQNAADAVAMREGAGHIGLSVTTQGGELHITVTDDGVGLPAEDRARLTEPYVTHKAKGTGLGLAISKRIIEMHGGRIWVESQVGRGSTFFAMIPVHAQAQTKTPSK